MARSEVAILQYEMRNTNRHFESQRAGTPLNTYKTHSKKRPLAQILVRNQKLFPVSKIFSLENPTYVLYIPHRMPIYGVRLHTNRKSTPETPAHTPHRDGVQTDNDDLYPCPEQSRSRREQPRRRALRL